MSEPKAPSRKTEEASVISAARGSRGGTALKAVTANRLTDGAVVYLTAEGAWVEAFGQARIGDGKDEAATLLADAEKDVARCQVVAPYLIDVSAGPDGALRPASYREHIRAFGPSTHPEFGHPIQSDATG